MLCTCIQWVITALKVKDLEHLFPSGSATTFAWYSMWITTKLYNAVGYRSCSIPSWWVYTTRVYVTPICTFSPFSLCVSTPKVTVTCSPPTEDSEKLIEKKSMVPAVGLDQKGKRVLLDEELVDRKPVGDN